jgi:mannose-1-phosphate guanylyltransferase
MTNVILCGGSGFRLWPVSREYYPKQFCNFIGEHSLFQETLIRNKKIFKKSVIVTNERHYPLAKRQIDELNMKNIEFILEPFGRNTAPAITAACLTLGKDEIVFVSPSDHFIGDAEKYRYAVEKAKTLAEAGWLVTFGIRPSYPETGFGYIEAENENVISFREKPNKTAAQKYVKSGKYYWNSGMFMFKAKAYLDEIADRSKEIFIASQEAIKNAKRGNGIAKIKKPYMKNIPSDSVDCAVMEKSKKIKMVALNTKWSDLGSFESIYGISDADKNGNVSGPSNILLNSKNNFIISKNKPVVLIDVNDLVIADTDDAILISKKNSTPKIKGLIEELEKGFPNITKKRIT